MTKKEMARLERQIVSELEPRLVDGKYYLDTKFGEYKFWFDENSIFGRFSDTERLKDGMKDVELTVSIRGVEWEVSHSPNVHSGKFNFHYGECYDFINTLDRMVS